MSGHIDVLLKEVRTLGEFDRINERVSAVNAVFHYTWDAADHLIRAQFDDVVRFEFGYDTQGWRIWKKSYGWANNDWELGQHLVFA